MENFMQKRILNNGIEIPPIMLGTSISDRQSLSLFGKQTSDKQLFNQMTDGLIYAVKNGITGIDTGRDYNNETILGDIFKDLFRNHIINRESLFITTKVGNGQQRLCDMEKELEISLKSLKLDYLDLWMLHWPLPDFYIDNWKQLCKIYKSGKVKAIGIANVRERHLLEMENADVEFMPQIVQVEYHPFRTIETFKKMCGERNIQVEAYTANCAMLPFVRENNLLNELAQKYDKSLTQIIMRWHVQQGVIPIFSSNNPKHISENIDVFDFDISDDDMKQIFDLNIDYKYHPESVNCPGY